MYSEKMKLCRMTVPNGGAEHAYQLVVELKHSGMIQCIDLNEKKNYYEKMCANEFKKCEEMEQKIDLIELEIRNHNARIPESDGHRFIPKKNDIIELETKLNYVYNDIIKNEENTENLFQNRSQLIELKTILENVKNFGLKQGSYEKINPENRLEFLAGIIKSTDSTAKATFLRRISRAQIFAKLFQIQKKTHLLPHHSHEKFVFILFFSGEKQRKKIKLICDGFKSKCYSIPEDSEERLEMLRRVTIQIDQMKEIVKKTFDYRLNIVHSAASHLKKWKLIVQELKSIYEILNMFVVDEENDSFISHCWIPEQEVHRVRNYLADKCFGSTFSTIMDDSKDDNQHNDLPRLAREEFQNNLLRF